MCCKIITKFLSSQGFTREYAREHIKEQLTVSAMCKRSTSATYLKVNALQDNAQLCVFTVTITVGQFL